MKNIFASFLISLLFLGVACKSHVPENLRETLIIGGAAKNVRYVKYGGSDQLTYTVETPYPASGVIESVSAQLARHGWTPLKEDWLNPGLASSHLDGWGSFGDATTKPHTVVFQWLAQWKDPNGNIVSYAFLYRDPGDHPVSMKPTSSTMEVSAAYFPRKVADAMIKWALSESKKQGK